MIKLNIDSNELIKYLALIENISRYGGGSKDKDIPQFLFRGESRDYDRIILPKYNRPLKGKHLKADSLYLHKELDIVKQFRNEASPYINNVSSSDYRRWREYAQHYAVPTKLLDWTSNPLVALYFSCQGNEGNGIVWMLDWQNYHANTNSRGVDNQNLENMTVSEVVEMSVKGEVILNNPVVYKPCYTNIRMSAQSSYFMLWGENKKDLISQIGIDKVKEAELFPTGKPITNRIKNKPILYYFEINSKEKMHILTELNKLGVNKKTIFPGLDGVGGYIDSINKYSEQEYIDWFSGS